MKIKISAGAIPEKRSNRHNCCSLFLRAVLQPQQERQQQSEQDPAVLMSRQARAVSLMPCSLSTYLTSASLIICRMVLRSRHALHPNGMCIRRRITLFVVWTDLRMRHRKNPGGWEGFAAATTQKHKLLFRPLLLLLLLLLLCCCCCCVALLSLSC